MNKFSICKSCGGTLNQISADTLQCKCCRNKYKAGEEQGKPVPEQLAMQLSQAGNYMALRRYDDAAETYRVITKTYPDEIRAYWGAALAEFGIEYTDGNGSPRPLTNRLSRHSFLDNTAYRKVIEKCGAGEREVYTMKANEIERIRSQTYEISKTQTAYEVFVYGGESANERSASSALKSALEARGRKVFAPDGISPKGVSAEAYIYPAIESSSVMYIVADSISTLEKSRNVWSRFLALSGKKLQVVHGGLNENEFPSVLRMAFQKREPISSLSANWLNTALAFADGEEKNKPAPQPAPVIDKAYVDEVLQKYAGGFTFEAKDLTEVFVMALTCMTAGNTFEAERVISVMQKRYNPGELQLISELCLELAKMTKASPAERQQCIANVGNISQSIKRNCPAITLGERNVYSEIGNAKLLAYLAKCFGAIRDYKRQCFVLDLIDCGQLYDTRIINELVNMLFVNNRFDDVIEVMRAVPRLDGDTLLLSFLKNFRGEQKLTLLMGIADKTDCTEKSEDSLNGYLSECTDTGVALAVVSIMTANKLRLNALGLGGALSNIGDAYGAKTVVSNLGNGPVDGVTVDKLVTIASNGGAAVAKEILKYLRFGAGVTKIGAYDMQRLINNCNLNSIKNELFAFNMDKKLAETLLIQSIRSNGAERLDNVKVLSEYVPVIDGSAYEGLLLGNDPLKKEFMRILAPKSGKSAKTDEVIEKYLSSRENEYDKREILGFFKDYRLSDRALEIYLNILPSAYGEEYVDRLKDYLEKKPGSARETFVKHYEALIEGYETVLPLIAGYIRIMPEEGVVRFVCEFKGDIKVKDALLISLMRFVAKPKRVEVKMGGVECNLLQAYLLSMTGKGDGNSEAVAYLRKCGLKADEKMLFNGKKTKFADYLGECALSSDVKSEIAKAIK